MLQQVMVCCEMLEQVMECCEMLKCETPRKSNFSQKWQNRNFGKNPKFF